MTILDWCFDYYKCKAYQVFLLILLMIFLSSEKCEAVALKQPDSSSNSILEISFCQPAARTTGTNEAFAADAPSVSLLVTSHHTEWAELNAHLLAEKVEGIKSQSIVADDGLFLAPEESKKLQFKAPAAGFLPGHYRVTVDIDGKSEQSLEFDIVRSEELKEPAAASPDSDTKKAGTSQQTTQASNPEPDSTKPPSGFNLALQALRGKLERWTSQADDDDFAAANLIDGFRFQTVGGDPNYCKPCGWRADNETFPQELVFSFHEGREALVDAVVLDTFSLSPWEDGKPVVKRFPKEVEVWVSSSSPTEGFSRVAQASLGPRVGEQRLDFEPVEARFVKLRILSTQGGAGAQLAEVKILEAVDPDESILHDLPRDIARPELGGSLVWATSASYDDEAAHLFQDDGKGWRSDNGELPQSLVLAFNDDRRALIDRVVVDPESGFSPGSRPKTVAISVADESPLKGFREVGRMALAEDSGPQALTVGEQSRYLKLDILENHGGSYSSLGRVRVFEGAGAGVPSVLTAPEAAESESDDLENGIDRGTAIAQEKEPNDEPVQATELELGEEIAGTIAPAGDIDHYRLQVPGGEKQVVNLQVSGHPLIDLLDPGGAAAKHLTLGPAGREVSFLSLAAPLRDLILRVSRPPTAVILMWDTSLSLKGEAGQVKAAVEGYIAQIPKGVKINLIPFAGKPKVLLEGFTDNKDRILRALEAGFQSDMGSALFDAIAKGLELLGQESGNRALIILSDGGVQGSSLSQGTLWRLLSESPVRLYTIGFGAALEDYTPSIGATNEGMLRHMAKATGGRYVRAQSAEALGGIYRRIAEELHGSPAYAIRANLSAVSGRLSLAQEDEKPESEIVPTVELVVDASGSMKERSPGGYKRRKIDLAMDVLSEIVDTLPEESVVALRVYGHRVHEGKPGDCEDTELLVPFRKIDKPRFKRAVRSIRPLGTTPLAYALTKAGEDLGGEEGDRWIVLITDGKEECGGDPAQAVAHLRDAGIRARIDVVGLALGDEQSKMDVRQYADLSGGSFFDAQDREALKNGIRKTLAVPFDVLDAAGELIARGAVGSEALELPEGVYTVVLPTGEGPATYPDIRITRDQDTRINVPGGGSVTVGD